MKTKLVLQHYGALIAVGIEGATDEIKRIANQLFNWGATESEPHFMSDNFAYILSDEERLVRLFSIWYGLKLRKRGIKRDARIPLANKLGLRDFEGLRWETFMQESELDKTPYQIGNANFSGLDE